MWVTENEMSQWVLAHARDAQGLIVELVWRLVCASAPKPKERRFPLGDSIGQQGPDGDLDVEIAHAFVPNGRSYWEIGTSHDAAAKATRDYRDLTEATPEEVRRTTTFVFVTPLSAAYAWKHTWKDNAQQQWLKKRRDKKEWNDVRVIDGTKLVDWVQAYPGVGRWFAKTALGVPSGDLETIDERWELIRSFGAPPPLAAQLFLARREEAKSRLAQVISGDFRQLVLSTRHPEDVVNFVAAYVATLDDDTRVETSGRCLIVATEEAWKTMTLQSGPLILVADSTLDLSGDVGGRLIQQARRGNHGIICGDSPGGVWDPTRAPLPSPTTNEIEDALKSAGYAEQRARGVAIRSGGDLPSLLRRLQKLSAHPSWSEGTAAAELAIAELLGSWDDSVEGDVRAAENLAGKGYGEWIGLLRDVAQRPGTPLIHQGSRWKFVPRYEGWGALGGRVFDEHLERFRECALLILTERDPQFELAPDGRLEAQIAGKRLQHSERIRSGVAETLALLGSYPRQLSSTSLGKPEETAWRVVYDLLNTPEWGRWASLNDVLPLLAEAAPEAFLGCVEAAIEDSSRPFAAIFAQESKGIAGRNYMTGLLWGLESLAWSPDYLVQVVRSLATLAEIDPGGNWANRPLNSLQTIFLPWLPQTCAQLPQRVSAVTALLAEHPRVGWDLLLNLLPDVLSSSVYTRRPMWRALVPEDWTPGVTNREYVEQIKAYSDLVVREAMADVNRLVDTVEHFNRLPVESRAALLTHIRSTAVTGLTGDSRTALWKALVELTASHRRHRDADWALPPTEVDEISRLTEELAPGDPSERYQRLFGSRDFELFEESNNYTEQQRRLDSERERAVREIEQNGGTPSVVAFAARVDQPGRVGAAFGDVAANGVDERILPQLLESESEAERQFVGGFIWGRLRREGWTWVDTLGVTGWTLGEIARFLSFLPFTSDTWDRAEAFLGANIGEYWKQANVNPPEAGHDLQRAIVPLLKNDRPRAAVDCLYFLYSQTKHVDAALAIHALKQALRSSGERRHIPDHETVAIIKNLQNDAGVSIDDLSGLEWAYLPLLNADRDAAPRTLEARLSSDASFFCEVIRLVYRSKAEVGTPESSEPPSDERTAMVMNGYRLLHEWTTPPGLVSDGGFDAAKLEAWLAEVRANAGASGHLDIAMLNAGQVLTYVPVDASGLWIDEGAARILDAKDSRKLRDGFRMQLFNSRGAHWVDPSGKQEDDFAKGYHRQAQELATAGFHRLAATIRELAKSYEQEAERVRAREGSEI